MALKLHRTLLTEKISWDSKLIGFLSLALLVALFFVEPTSLHASGKKVFIEGQYWRAFTTTFVHADYQHLVHNAVGFTLLSVLLNNYFGNFVYPLLSLVMGGVINLIVLATYPQDVHLVGISGVVYFMAAFWLSMFLYVERTQDLKRRLIIATGVGLIFLAPEAVLKENVSYMAHGVGFVLGVASGALFYLSRKEEIHGYDQWIETRPAPLWLEEAFFVPTENVSDEASPSHPDQIHCSCR